MVKLDYERDYYADLELPGPADPVEVKKQFKKLALKFHPDRNPGREEAAKEKFLVIQAAHEILTDPVSKSKFDAYRQRTSRYPAASGVRGNPWQNMAQDVNQKFGAPPKRPQMPTRPPAPTAASTKHWDWAQKAKSKTESMRANMDAWDRAKAQTKPSQTTGAGAGSSARPAQPREPPQAPRTASQARKQDAAFGNRKGYAPGSPMGDEPPVRNQHYNTSAHTAQPRPRPTSAYVDPTSAYVVDPLSAQFSETYVDNRQRTPYAANVGEKTNPFEPLNVNRAKSMRDGARRFHDQAEEAPPPPPPRQRSASTGSENFKRSTNESPAYQEPAAPRPGHQFQSRASARYSPRGPETNSAPPTATTFPGPTSSTSSVNSSTNATVNGHASNQTRDGTKVYESSFFTSSRNFYPNSFAKSSAQTPHPPGAGVGARAGAGMSRAKNFDFPTYRSENASPTPSGERPSPGANAFEEKLQAQLQHLLHKARTQPSKPAVRLAPSSTLPKKPPHWTDKYANSGIYPNSFSVPDDDANSPAQPARFSRNSADNINTRFVSEERDGTNFQFSAGAAGSAEDGFLRAKQRARGHQSPLRNEFTASGESVNGAQQAEANKKQGNFVPEEWKFGPDVFVPPQPGKASVSPTRPLRPIKKPRPVRMTAGTAGMVDDEETSGEDKGKATPASGISGSRSPNAMDIDTPPPEPATGQPHVPRNINVEPTKPEWRAGNGATAEPKLGAGLKAPNLKPNSAGSEDTEEFIRPVFPEFQNVEPFAPPKPSGLSSFADLSSNLPFQSRPSAKIPLAHEKPKPIDIPSPPAAPRAPASLCIPGAKVSAPAWLAYESEFTAYMAQWSAFNRKMTDHFAARQKQNENNGLAWLNAVGDTGVSEYQRALEVDRFVRQRWTAASDAHELHFREFCGVRERVGGN